MKNIIPYLILEYVLSKNKEVVMKRFAIALIALFTILAVSDSFAQKRLGAYKDGSQFWGGEVGIAVPMGDFANVANLGVGVNALYNYYIDPKMFIGAMIGYYTHSTDLDGYSFSNIPVVGGFYYHLKNTGGFRTFVGGELGINFVSTKYEYQILGINYSESDSKSRLSIAPCVGAILPLKSMEGFIKARYVIMDDADSFVISGGIRIPL